MEKRGLLTLAVAVVIASALSNRAEAVEQKPVLTLEMAKAMADACEAAQAEAGWRPLNIAIYDDGANLKLFRRQENAFLGSIQVSRLKANTSASFPFPSRLIAELAYGKDGEPGPLPGVAEVPGLAAFAGGLPIMTKDGQHIGGIGVSGASADEDEACAQAGIDAIADML